MYCILSKCQRAPSEFDCPHIVPASYHPPGISSSKAVLMQSSTSTKLSKPEESCHSTPFVQKNTTKEPEEEGWQLEDPDGSVKDWWDWKELNEGSTREFTSPQFVSSQEMLRDCSYRKPVWDGGKLYTWNEFLLLYFYGEPEEEMIKELVENERLRAEEQAVNLSCVVFVLFAYGLC